MKKNINKFLTLLLLFICFIENSSYSMNKSIKNEQKNVGFSSLKEKLEELSIENMSEIAKLAYVANILLYQKTIVHLLRFLEPVSRKLIETSGDHLVSYLMTTDMDLLETSEMVKDQGYHIEPTNSDNQPKYEHGVRLYTPEAQAFVLKYVTKRSPSSHCYYENVEYYNFLHKQLELHSNNPEIGIITNNEIHRYGRAIINTYLISNNLIPQGIISLLYNCSDHNMFISAADIEKEALESIQDNSFTDFLEKWLERGGLNSIVKKLIPNFVTFFKKCGQLVKLLDNLKKEDSEFYKPFNKTQSQVINSFINLIIKDFEQYEKESESTYRKIIELRNFIIKDISISNPREFLKAYMYVRLSKPLNLRNCNLPLTIDSNNKEFLKFLENYIDLQAEKPIIETSNNENSWLDFIINNRKQNLDSSTCKKSKKTRRRPHRRELQKPGISSTINDNPKISKPEVKETFEEPEYDQRITRWFDSNFTQDKDYNSILYHTYCPIADMLIKKYGNQTIRKNKTFNTQDTVYSTLGMIIYPNGSSQNVLFVNCYGQDGLCYHRGFEKMRTLMQSTDSTLASFIDSVSSEIDKDLKSKKFFLKDLYYSQYNLYQTTNFKENHFCFHIKDPKNNVTLVLFK